MTTPLQAGSATVEITPPLQVGFLRSAVRGEWQRFAGIRQALQARALLLAAGGERCAWIAADVLGFSSAAFGPWREFKERICAAAGHPVAPENLLLTATHTHSAPETIGLSGLSETAAFAAWREALLAQLGRALREAAAALSPRRLGVAQTELKGLTIHRRVRGLRGIELTTVVTDAVRRQQAHLPNDESVWIAAFTDEEGAPREVCVNATCHPVYEMCRPEVSPDFPGALSAELARRQPSVTTLFFNGAAGNINPLAVSGGPAPAEAHGRQLARVVADTLQRLTPVSPRPFSLRRQRVPLRCRPETQEFRGPWWEAELTGVRFGTAAFLFLPGEPFVETGLACRRQSPFGWTAIVGYAEDSVGYIPTDEAFDAGGYETGPGRWSFLARGCEPTIRRAATELLRELASAAT